MFPFRAAPCYDPRRRDANRQANGRPRPPAGLDLAVGSVRETRKNPCSGTAVAPRGTAARSVVPARVRSSISAVVAERLGVRSCGSRSRRILRFLALLARRTRSTSSSRLRRRAGRTPGHRRLEGRRARGARPGVRRGSGGGRAGAPPAARGAAAAAAPSACPRRATRRCRALLDGAPRPLDAVLLDGPRRRRPARRRRAPSRPTGARALVVVTDARPGPRRRGRRAPTRSSPRATRPAAGSARRAPTSCCSG